MFVRVVGKRRQRETKKREEPEGQDFGYGGTWMIGVGRRHGRWRSGEYHRHGQGPGKRRKQEAGSDLAEAITAVAATRTPCFSPG